MADEDVAYLRATRRPVIRTRRVRRGDAHIAQAHDGTLTLAPRAAGGALRHSATTRSATAHRDVTIRPSACVLLTSLPAASREHSW